MAKYIVYEVVDDRLPLKSEVYESPVDGHPTVAYLDFTVDKFPILRRLTDEEVAKLVALQPADDERGRFVRETAAMVMAHQFAMWTVAEIEDGDHSVSYSEGAIDQIVKAAESLAAKVF